MSVDRDECGSNDDELHLIWSPLVLEMFFFLIPHFALMSMWSWPQKNLSIFHKFLFFETLLHLKEKPPTRMLAQPAWLHDAYFSRFCSSKFLPKIFFPQGFSKNLQNFVIFEFDKFDAIWQIRMRIEWQWIASDPITLSSRDILFFCHRSFPSHSYSTKQIKKIFDFFFFQIICQMKEEEITRSMIQLLVMSYGYSRYQVLQSFDRNFPWEDPSNQDQKFSNLQFS